MRLTLDIASRRPPSACQTKASASAKDAKSDAPDATKKKATGKIEPVEAVLETEHYRLGLTNNGGRAFTFDQKLPERYQGFDYLEGLVGSFDPLDPPSDLPFGTSIDDIGLGATTPFELVSTEAGEDGHGVLFRWTSKDGNVTVDKLFSPGRTDHAINLALTVDNKGSQTVSDDLVLEIMNTQVGDAGSFLSPSQPMQAICRSDGDVERVDPGEDAESYDETIEWIGIDEAYFGMLVRSEDGIDECRIEGIGEKDLHAQFSSDLTVPAQSARR